MTELNPKAVGEISEGVVLGTLLKLGKIVLMPFGDNQRYDFVLDENGTFVRVQVKTGRLQDGAIIFKTSSVNGFTGKRTSYHGQADVIMVYCPETDGVYQVPVSECGSSMMRLRVEPGKKNFSGSKWARDYLIG